jgi:Fe-S oxidoreductase
MDESIFSCLQCGYCESTCPVYDQIGWESVAPRGKIYYLKQLRNRGILDRLLFRNKTFDPDFIKRLYQCSGCGACEQVCHTGLKLQDLWMELKESLVRNNIPLPNGLPNLPSKIQRLHSPYEESAKVIGKTGRNKNIIKRFGLPKKADYVLFLGCTPSTFLNGLTESSIKILKSADVNFTLIEDEWCCSSVLGVTGYGNSKEFETHAEHNLEKIEEIGAKTVISSCPWCYKSFTEMYPKYVKEPEFQILHFTEFLMDLFDRDKLSLTKSFEKPVTYHDPCRLGRLSGIFEPPRKILENIPGISMEELSDNKLNCNCCGNYCGISNIDQELSLKMSIRKVREALDTSADVLVSSCPNCRLGLGNALQEWDKRHSTTHKEMGLEIMDLTELVANLI